jgi:hypothetical protein
MTETNPNDALARLAELERRAALQASTEVERDLSRQRFLARIDGALEASQPRAQWLRWGAAAAAALCVAAALLLFWRTPALTFQVQGAELSGKYVSAPPERSAELRFSDESTLVATAGSRLRVEDTSPLGARILLERGSTSVKVVHKTSTAWTFAAGPFEVRVTGTRFDLAWDPSRETCDLVLHEGSVEVRGPTGSGPVVVRGGQRFRGDAQQRTMQVVELEAHAGLPPVTEAKPAPGSSVAPAAPVAPEQAEPTPAVVASGKATRPEARAPSWSKRIAQGDFKEIVSEAEARGIPGCLSGCSATDLRALSDAARYTGNSALAQRSLTSLRQRFPGAQGTEAAFLLGRLEEQRGAMSTALTWYDSYLREAPSGSFAAEALAGKLRAVKATQGKQAAEPLAREYLRRFPKGVHVRTAREVLGE